MGTCSVCSLNKAVRPTLSMADPSTESININRTHHLPTRCTETILLPTLSTNTSLRTTLMARKGIMDLVPRSTATMGSLALPSMDLPST